MKQELITKIMQKMLPYLDNAQLKRLRQTMEQTFFSYEVIGVEFGVGEDDSNDLINKFIAAKRIEGCSEKTLKYYQTTINAMVLSLGKNVRCILTENLRTYLTDYQSKNQLSRVTIDNIRRILSSFFSWLEDEDYIIKSPVRRIHKVKTTISIKETYLDEDLEKMRDSCEELRDLAMIDMLASTEYLGRRSDDNPALFVSLKAPYKRMQIGGIEYRLREMGRRLSISNVHPHKFRRTLATLAIDKGMPIEQLQRLLGHKRIDTTLQYAMVKQSNVKTAHRKYIG